MGLIKKDNLLTGKAVMSYVQIILMILGLFAFSWSFDEYSSVVKKSVLDLEAIAGISFPKVSTGMGSVSAATGDVCCERTLSGNSCQTTSSTLCDGTYKISPTNCENSGFCEVGCCISEQTGLCNLASSRVSCEAMNGTFKTGASCNVAECKLGCCVLGDQAKWTTQANCAYEGNSENDKIATVWNYDETSDTELKCLFSVERDKEGACLFEDDGEKKCVFTTLETCVSQTGSEINFDQEGRFCSDPVFETTCKAQDHKGCVAGNEEVYWFDSCGNKESVAHDCNLFKGSYCGVDDGEYSCRDVDCDIDNDGTTDKKNGESWCSYDGKIGDGKDSVGSRHIKHVCYFGKERLAPCADYRNEICVGEESVLTDGGTFSQAACRVNQWRACLDYNKDDNSDSMKTQCEKNVDCKVKSIDMGGSFSFSVCTPNYPPGFDINVEPAILDESGSVSDAYYKTSSADGICSAATQRCTETWKCGIFGCVCIDNCKCHTATFTTEMNDLCISLGDCGAYTNYIGKTTDDGYAVRAIGGGGPPRLDANQLNSFSQNAVVQKNQKPALPGENTFFGTLNPELLPEVGDESNNLSAFERELLGVSGSYGSGLLLKILTSKNESGVWENLGSISAGAIGLSTYTGAISSLQASIRSQTQAPEKEEKQDFSMIIATVVALIAYVITQSIIAAMVAALLGFLFGISWIKHVHIDFTCSPWQPPSGGADCNACNSLSIPCTEYRCESLGSSCYLANKGTGNELCLSKPANETLPMIKPLESALSVGYRYEDVTKNGFKIVNASSGECIEPYTSVDFGIFVDPFARCRWSNNSADNYEDMYELFGLKGNYLLPAHLTTLFFPNPEAFKNKYNLTDQEIKDLGKWDFFVKCKSGSGKVNVEPYAISTCIKPGPDLTPPRVTLTQPFSKSYLPFGSTNQNITLYVNEPSECKWSTQDKEFDLMEQSLACETDVRFFTQFGWKCGTSFDVRNQTKFYVRCKDTSENANVMSESYAYEFIASSSTLAIGEVLPQAGQKIISGVEPVSVTLKLSTQGGIKQGEAQCTWEGNGYGDNFRYTNVNGSSIHEYKVNLAQGNYHINFSCFDAAKNTASNTTEFSVRIDKFGPTITRVYYDSGLKVITAENSECRFDFRRDFIFENATKMSGNQKEHTTDWRLKTYYVQCKDNYGNSGGTFKLKPVN